jgi:hypothetical protein
METIMSFDYDLVSQKAPFFALIKNLEFIESNSEKVIQSGEIVSISLELSHLLTELGAENIGTKSEIYFFGGTDQDVLFYFLKTYFENHKWTSDIHTLFRDILFDFFERMISIKGERKKHPYDLWHEFLYFLYYQDLIQDDVFEEYREDKYF